MRPRIALIALVLLAGAPAAQAKERPAQICGAGGCTAVTARGDIGYLHSTFGPRRAPKPAPFYVVRFCSQPGCRGPSAWSYVYVPSARAMRADNLGSGPVRWMHASLLGSLLAELTKDLEPSPASPTWTPTVAKADDATGDSGRPLGWIAVVVAAATIAIVLWRFRSRHRFA